MFCQKNLVFIKTQGCKVNIADSMSIGYLFEKSGFELVNDFSKAFYIVINSCSVTYNAQKQARYLIRRYSKTNPQAKIIFTGCYAQIDGLTIDELSENVFVVPNQSKNQLLDFVKNLQNNKIDDKTTKINNFYQTNYSTTNSQNTSINLVKNNKQNQFKTTQAFFASHSLNNYTRSFVKIQDGCNDFCSYCQIPYARGASVSVPKKTILKEIQRLMLKNCKEIVICGIHLSEWGKDLANKDNFIDLLQDIVSIMSPDSRLRLSSLEPSKFDMRLFDFIADNKQKICAHMHFPLQSGSTRILKLMRRSYNPDQYLKTVELANQAFYPVVAHISADVMVGFPSELDSDFDKSIDLIKNCQLSSLHVFSYSKRPNTAALKINGHLPQNIIKKRSKIMRDVAKDLKYDFYNKFIGAKVSVLWEKRYDSHGYRLGKSSQYLDVCKKFDSDKIINSIKNKSFISDHIVKRFNTSDLLEVY